MARLKKKIKSIWLWIVAWFSPRWELVVSYNKTFGDADDRIYTVKKFLIKKDKHLKFVTHEKEVVEIKSTAGLNYRITTK